MKNFEDIKTILSDETISDEEKFYKKNIFIENLDKKLLKKRDTFALFKGITFSSFEEFDNFQVIRNEILELEHQKEVIEDMFFYRNLPNQVKELAEIERAVLKT